MSDILRSIQQEMFVEKGHKNEYGKFQYRKLDDIIVALKPLAEKYKQQLVTEVEPIFLSGRFYIKVMVGLEPDGCRAFGYAREPDGMPGMSESQVTGTATTYATKAAWSALISIQDQPDPDERDSTKDYMHNLQSILDTMKDKETVRFFYNKKRSEGASSEVLSLIKDYGAKL